MAFDRFTIIYGFLVFIVFGFIIYPIFFWNKNFRNRKPRRDPSCISNSSLSYEKRDKRVLPNKLQKKKGSLVRLKSQIMTSLDMDHLPLPLFDYILGSAFIGTPAAVAWICGMIKLWWKRKTRKSYPDEDFFASILAIHLLESFRSINFVSIKDENFAIFDLDDAVIISRNGNVEFGKKLEIVIDLKIKKAIKAEYQGSPIKFSNAFTIVYLQSISGEHIPIHAYANWGSNTYNSNSFINRMSKISILYNFFGVVSFAAIMDLLFSIGFSKEKNFNKIMKLIAEKVGETAGVKYHRHLNQIKNHSTMISFILKVQQKFFDEFKIFKEELHGIDGHAMFVTTVIHSLDHYMMEVHLPDPTILDQNDEIFGKMNELIQIVRVGFVAKPRGYIFKHTFKDAPHPFYQNIYNFAEKLNPELANQMDACIIR